MLQDSFGREINYLRLAVTDRCNLRCFYCMPECGIDFVKQAQLLSYEEMLRLVKVGVSMGINKVRITGGEPFVRRDLVPFLKRLSDINGLDSLNITTNGTLTEGHVEELKRLGISINLSWDTLDRDKFHQITRRDELETVNLCFEKLMTHGVPTKINMVVINGQNDDDIVPMAMLAKHNPVEVRFLEEMPFNGGDSVEHSPWSYQRILEKLEDALGALSHSESNPGQTADVYRIDGWKGSLGIIASHSRTFCGSCNRLRITPQGQIRTCLYSPKNHNLRDFMRSGASDVELEKYIQKAINSKAKNGHEAEAQAALFTDSMATIGG